MYDHERKIWRFPGGLRLESHKKQSTKQPLRQPPIPARITLPVQQHIGAPAESLVNQGDFVYKGQPIARPSGYISAPVHASTSGTVVKIANEAVPHPSGLTGPCVTIDTDGLDQWYPHQPKPITDYTALDPTSLRVRVRESGIVGLGGAAFPTAVKLNPQLNHPPKTLVINGVECEPYISCDDMLMRERYDEILEGVRIVQHALEMQHCIIAIEDEMTRAIDAMQAALDRAEIDTIELVSVPTIYPAGGERQLVKVLTGKEVPSNGFPQDIGIICHNVGTAYAVYQAVILGQPLISRIVTVTGKGINSPCNLEVLLGTPISHVIEACGGYTPEVERLIMGGPMMGFALSSDEVPVIKSTNCVLAASAKEVETPSPAMPCIRCGECAHVCPSLLLPQELYRYARTKEFDKIQELNLFDCIECGCCAYVCPSHIPLVHYYRFAKNEIAALERERKLADKSRQRYEYRQQRLAQEKSQRAERLAKKKAALTSFETDSEVTKKAAIEAAVERAKAKKADLQTKANNSQNGFKKQRQAKMRQSVDSAIDNE